MILEITLTSGADNQVVGALNGLGGYPELVEWFGDEFPFEMNPFLLGTTLADKASDLGLAVLALPTGNALQAAVGGGNEMSGQVEATPHILTLSTAVAQAQTQCRGQQSADMVARDALLAGVEEPHPRQRAGQFFTIRSIRLLTFQLMSLSCLSSCCVSWWREAHSASLLFSRHSTVFLLE